MTPACSGLLLAWLARPVRPVPSKTLLSPVLGTPQSSSLQPCVPRPGPSLTLDPDWLGPIQTRRIVTNRSQETREGVNTSANSVYEQVPPAAEWVWAVRGKQTRPESAQVVLGISGNTNVKLQLPHFS